jgi:ketosteroid isomerase-like protein
MAADLKALVRDFLQTLHSGDAAGALAYTNGAPSFLVFNDEIPGGVTTFAQMIPGMFKDGPHREYTAQYVDGDTVISEVTITGTTAKDEFYHNFYLIIVHFADGKITKIKEYMDSAYAHKKFAPPQ